jgi:hypothetical protein
MVLHVSSFAANNNYMFRISYNSVFHYITIITILLFASLNAIGQGVVQGVVKDKKSGETIVGANVRLKGTMLGAATNLDGTFTIANVPAGVYEIVCSFISYKTIEIPGVKVETGQTASFTFELEQHVSSLLGFTISAKRTLHTEASIIGTLKSSNLVLSGISSEQISRSQDGDAAQVVKRVPGVTIVGNRFIMIRGLSERYNAVLLDGTYAPSMEADVRSFSFDVVPSGMIDRILIYKSPSPELPGDFAGGVVKIFTKGIPEKNSTQISYSTTYRQATSFRDFDSPNKGALYFTGFNDGYQNLPSDFPTDIRDIDNDPAKVDYYGQALRNNWVAETRKAIPDQSVSASISRRFMVKGRQAGSITSVSYSNSRRNEEVRRRDYNAYDIEKGVQSVIYDFNDHNYKQNIRLGILSNWSLEINNKHSIDFKNLFNQISSAEYVHRSGPMYEFNYNANNHSFYQIFRGIYSGQLTGLHKFNQNSTSDWVVGYGYSYRDEPDYRRYRSDLDTVTGESTLYVPFGTAQAYFLGRFFSEMRENNLTAAYNHKQVFKLKNSTIRPAVTAGLYFEMRARSFRARNIGYVRSSIIGFDGNLLDASIDELFQKENINQTAGIRIDEQSNPSDSYEASNRLAAGYTNLMIPVSKKIALNGGARLEYNYQTLNSRTLTDDAVDVAIPELSLLPSANITYNFTKKALVRFAYGKTVNKPEFRELAPFGFYDFNFNLVRKGSDSIRMSTAHSFDLRWEFYPTPRELITVGVFFKRFNDPIENSFVPGGGSGGIKTFTFANAEAANNWGIEAEMRHSLDGYTSSRHINNLSIVFNAALIRSKVELGAASLGQGVESRAMFGQSPYIVNAGLYYNDPKSDIQVNLLYNVIGKRIYIIGYDEYPDIYEMPRHLLDLTITKIFRKTWEVKLGFGDLINQEYVLMQDANRDGVFDQETDQVMQIYTSGRTISLGLTYKF